jgi:hypothetical protein
MSPRTLLAVAGWLVAAVAATVTGLAAVRVIGAGITGPAGELVSADVARSLAAATPSPVGPTAAPVRPTVTATAARPTATTPSATPGASRVVASPGGTVVARCDGATAVLVTWAPAQGYRVKRADQQPGDDHARVTFEGSGGRVEVDVRCAAGQLSVSWK